MNVWKLGRVVLFFALGLLPFGAAQAQMGPCMTPIGPDLPDLIVDQHMMRAQMYLTEETFSAAGCTFREGCISAPGTHLLLRFMSSTPNVGKTDLFVGNPNNCLGSLFRFSECHQHLHFQEYADYRLWTLEGYEAWVANRDLSQPTNQGNNASLLQNAVRHGELLFGRKQGFCIIDVAPFKFGDTQPGPPRYQSCSANQGIKVGWADQYVPLLACQFIQMTGVPEGTYVLEDHVNPEHLFPESDFTNNTAAVIFRFRNKPGRFGPVIEVLEPNASTSGGRSVLAVLNLVQGNPLPENASLCESRATGQR